MYTVEVLGFLPIAIITIIIIVIIAYHKSAKRWRENIIRKYPDPEIHNKIFNKVFWIGETREMLIDSIGNPLDIDHKVTKTKTIEILKYNRLGANRYGTRITIENGLVAGWELK